MIFADVTHHLLKNDVISVVMVIGISYYRINAGKGPTINHTERFRYFYIYTHSSRFTNSINHLTQVITGSRTHSNAQSNHLTCTGTYSVAHSIIKIATCTHWCNNSRNHSLTEALTRSITHSLRH